MNVKHETSADWLESWNKWSGDIWEKLKASMFHESTREDAWHILLWNGCGYCDEYADEDDKSDLLGCGDCPLYMNNGCFSDVDGHHHEPTVLTHMYNAWIEGKKTRFNEHLRVLRKKLKETKF